MIIIIALSAKTINSAILKAIFPVFDNDFTSKGLRQFIQPNHSTPLPYQFQTVSLVYSSYWEYIDVLKATLTEHGIEIPVEY